jgi:hypothetical protein
MAPGASQAEATPTLRGYQPRLDSLLAAVAQLGDPADRAAARRLAADARLLALDLGSVFDRLALVGLLEKLAAALASGQATAIGDAARHLREEMRADAPGRRQRSFWR